MIIILSFSDTTSPSSVMISCITEVTFNLLLLAELGACTDLLSEFPVVADAAARGGERSSHMPAVPVVASVACLDAVQLRKTFLVCVFSRSR
jgi:hypothetical protein